MTEATDHSTENFDNQPLNHQLWPILLLTTIFFVNFIARIALAPMIRPRNG